MSIREKTNNHFYVGPLKKSDAGRRVEFDVVMGKKEHRIYFSANNVELAESVEASIAATLLPFMMSGGGTCEITGTVSERFLTSLERIQEIYYTWIPKSRRVTFAGNLSVVKKQPENVRTGAFFSAGVDSFYTFLRHESEIATLIFVHGLDISLDQRSLYQKTSDTIKRIAEETGKNVIELETNLRSLLDPYISWVMSHGAALASAGLLLSSQLNKIYIASSYVYANLHPFGSHPFLDPLWSTESMDFIHDGCETDRSEKTTYLAQHGIALHTLRVCWRNPNESYNCGKCRKCLATMIDLHVAGKLRQCTTFDVPLDIQNIYALNMEGDILFSFLKGNLLALEKQGMNPELCEALRNVLEKQRYGKELLGLLKITIKDILRRTGLRNH